MDVALYLTSTGRIIADFEHFSAKKYESIARVIIIKTRKLSECSITPLFEHYGICEHSRV